MIRFATINTPSSQGSSRMTHCNLKMTSFSSLGSKKIEADFNGGRITSDTGALLLREIEQQTGLIKAMNKAIPDPRDPARIEHDQQSMLAQRVFGIALGYEDLNDHATMRADPALLTAVGQSPDDAPEAVGASAPTLHRLENRIDRKTLFHIADAIINDFIASYKMPPESLILDFDATDSEIHGHQEGRFFHGYYDSYCYLPLYVFCGDSLLAAYLRPSKIDAAKHTQAILKLIVTKLRAVWPNVLITIRADSGFCRWRLLRWCDSNGIGYIIGLAQNKKLLEMSAELIETAARTFQATGEKQRIFGMLHYGAATWDRKRRVIAKAEYTEKGSNPRFVVTNVPGDAQSLYDDVYCQRGEMENRIKEQQHDLFANRTSCHRFLANQFRLLLSAAAYILMEKLRRVGLKGTLMERAQVGTIRLKLLKVASRVVVSARRVVFHLSRSYPYQALFREVLSRLTTSEELRRASPA